MATNNNSNRGRRSNKNANTGNGREIFISVDEQEIRVAVTENKRLDEFYVERAADSRMVGSVYKGKVTSVVPGINAAFVDIGLGKNGFLYVSDIVEQKNDEEAILEGDEVPPKPKNNGHGKRSKIEEVVRVDQEIMVQVVKEPFGTKGARLTSHISLPGRYMVMMSSDPRIGISKKIDDPQERSRLREILPKLKFSDEAGLIIRTAGMGKGEKEFTRDVKYLSKIYERIKQNEARCKAPAVLHQEYPLSQRVIRDSFSEDDVTRIVVDSKQEFDELKKFLQVLMPGVNVKVDLYRNNKVSLFAKEGLLDQIERIFEKNVKLPSGGSIVVEPTEGLVAIDVNTAKFTGKRNLEETAFQVNKEAAVEVARQLRLRDIGGIVVIDFIDLDVPSHKRELVKILEDALERDRAKTNLVSFSEICVAELTRQRMRRSVETVSYQTCPYCLGKGNVKSSVTMAIEGIRQANRALSETRNKTLELKVHPQVAMRLLQEDKQSLTKLEQRSHARILVLSDPAMHIEEIKVKVA